MGLGHEVTGLPRLMVAGGSDLLVSSGDQIRARNSLIQSVNRRRGGLGEGDGGQPDLRDLFLLKVEENHAGSACHPTSAKHLTARSNGYQRILLPLWTPSQNRTTLRIGTTRQRRHKQDLEGGGVELDGLGEGPVVLVDHRDGLTRRKRPKAVRRVGADFVEIDDAETGERGKRLVERPAASDARAIAFLAAVVVSRCGSRCSDPKESA
jgi:hypothetical protein